MKNITLSLATLSLLFLIALTFVLLHLAITATAYNAGPFVAFFAGCFGFIGKALLFTAFLYVAYRGWVHIKMYHILFEIPRLMARGFFFIVGLCLGSIGAKAITSLYGIICFTAGCALVLFILGKGIVDVFHGYKLLLRRRIVK